jgi:GTP-binding protein Era
VKSGFVAVAGRPNVGKSTLVNALCGGKVAIVSDKPQTTRRRISGVANGDGYQLVLVDLPGFQRPRDALTEHMQRTVDESFDDVDAVLFVLPVNEPIGGGDRLIARRVLGGETPVVVAVSKVDLAAPAQIAGALVGAAALGDAHAYHPVSAATGDGVDSLRAELAALLPEGPVYFPDGELTDQTVEAQIAELVREQALAMTREEVPHAVTVEVDELTEERVRAIVWVETESQKAIVVGKGGRMIRDIGSRARPEIESLLARGVYLELMVKVRPRWRRDEAMLARLGI